jgi:hypothetical protein
VTYANYGSVPSQRRRWTEPEATYGQPPTPPPPPPTYGGNGGSEWNEPGPEQHDRVAAEIRNLVVDRLSQMNAQHALNAWEFRRKTPIGPHALAFFYLEQIEPGSPPRYATPMAARLFLDGEDVAFLPELLYKMVGIGRRRLARGEDFDPLTSMARAQDEISPRAQYIGVGVSSLETPAMSWAEIQENAFGPLDIPGRGMAILTDGTRLVLERGDRSHGPTHVRSSHQLDLVPGIPSRRWTWLRDTVEPNSAEYWLQELHQAVLEGQRRMEERSRHRRR